MKQNRLQESIDEIVDIVACAGGELIGRTRLQKTVFLLSSMGLSERKFHFSYKHYGPFSDSLASMADIAQLFGGLEEVQQRSSWGGTYSVFRTKAKQRNGSSAARLQVIEISKNANAIDLELAATAAFLASEGCEDPWAETASRKPEKRDRIATAKALYKKFFAVQSPRQLPNIP